jgi:tetratricopeptide (TPR) repeat protein
MQPHRLWQSSASRLLLAAICGLASLNPMRVHAQREHFSAPGATSRVSLHGQVVTTNGQAPGDVRIELRNSTGRTISTVLVASSGWFEFDDLEPGFYEVIASAGTEQSATTVHISSLDTPLTIQIGSEHPSAHEQAAVSVNALTVPSRARKAFEAADRLLVKSDFAGAMNQINKALEAHPKFAAALTLRGVLKMHSNQPQEALDDFTAALEADHGYHLAYVGLAADYNLIGRFDEALRVLDQASSLSAQSWQGHFEASKALLGKKSFDRALQKANQAAKLLGHDFPMLNVVKAYAYLGLNDTNSAATELRQYLRQESIGAQADKARAILANIDR